MANQLFYGDNLPILRTRLGDASVDLIYLDPPFNSNRSYNVLFKEEGGEESESQITAFDDTWHWNRATAETYRELVTDGPVRVRLLMNALRELVGDNQLMAYLTMMAARLVELHRVLKPTGSLYLHCDPTASHYLKMVLDTIFGSENFRSEIIWKRTSAHSSAKRYGPIHDVIFFYTKSDEFVWNPQYMPYEDSYAKEFYRHVDKDGRRFTLGDLTGAGIRKGETGRTWRRINVTKRGRHWMVPPKELDKLDTQGLIYWPEKGKMPRLKRYLDDMPGTPLQDIFNDIPPVSAHAAERLGYPTQKPLALLERIIQASSNAGDVVLDPFCGCGTTIAAAQQLGRTWIGVDITHLSIALQKNRLKEMFELTPSKDYEVIGEPEDAAAARQLAQDNRHQFEWWALSLVGARPVQEGGDSAPARRIGKKGSDKGVDGVITFMDDATEKLKRVLVQVKSGRVTSGDIRDLLGAVESQHAELGIFITLEAPTREMQTAAHAAGFYHSTGWERDYPRLQILTIADLLRGAQAQLPPVRGTFKRAARAERAEAKQVELGM